MGLSTGQKILLLVVIVVNILLWALPSDVVELIARDRQTLLGRYSRTHFYWNAALLPISLIVLYIGLGRRVEIRKKRAFRVMAASLAVVPTTCAADLLVRRMVPVFYIKDTLAYHRPPHQRIHSTVADRPEAARTYAKVPPSFGTVDYALQADGRGFRNQTDGEHYDVVALGDSFTEGSKVSDESPWPVRFAERSGLAVYNLGMSGYAPQHYLASLKEVGLGLQPRCVICVLYEENDFRSAKLTDRPPRKSRKFFKRSPLLYLLDQFFVRTLAPLNARGEVEGIEVLSWLPLGVPVGPEARYYAFSPKLMMDLYVTEAKLKEDRRWGAVTDNLAQMDALCREAGAEFILVYAPSKVHVLLPLARAHLDAEKVHGFARLGTRHGLPSPEPFVDELFRRLDTKESAVTRWCREKGIELVSLTEPLREAAARAEQVYFTYDDHWSPVGHDLVAKVVYDFWRTRADRSAIAHRPFPKAPGPDGHD